MTRKNDLLDLIRVARPCSTSWDLMTGDDRARFCAECNKQVYNFAEMTRSEAEALLGRSSGQICARLERTADGRIVTAPEPITSRRLRLNMPNVAAAIAAALVSTGIPVGEAAPRAARPPVIQSKQADRSADQKTQTDPESSLSGTILDASGA